MAKATITHHEGLWKSYIDSMQFGFMPDKSTMDAIFIALQIFAVNLEKAYDWVPRGS